MITNPGHLEKNMSLPLGPPLDEYKVHAEPSVMVNSICIQIGNGLGSLAIFACMQVGLILGWGKEGGRSG